MIYVYQAPDTLRLSRSEPNRVARFVQISSHAIDPTETQCFVEGFRIGNALLAGVLLVEANQQLALRIMILQEPVAKFGRCFEELGFRHLVGACPGNQAGLNEESASHLMGFINELIDCVMKGKSTFETSSPTR